MGLYAMGEETKLRLEQLRSELVDFTLKLFAYSLLVILPLFYWRVVQERVTAPLFAQLFPLFVGLVIVGLHLGRKKLSPTIRAILLSALLLACSVAGLILRGILGPAFSFMLLAIICLCLILPLRQMLIAGILIILVNVAVVVAHLAGTFPIDIDPVKAFTAPAAWFSYLAVPVYASVLIIFSFSRFNDSLMNILDDLEREKSTVEHMASHDQLTGLPNMRIMLIKAEQAFAIAQRQQSKPALLFVDLDHFKEVNDQFGHQTGDFVLQKVARDLQGILRASDSVVRNGGDEFLVLLTDYKSTEGLFLVAEKICKTLSKPFQSKDCECRISCSIGIAIYSEFGDDFETLYRQADHAMYEVKKTGKNGYKVYQSSDGQSPIDRPGFSALRVSDT